MMGPTPNQIKKIREIEKMEIREIEVPLLFFRENKRKLTETLH